MFQFIFVLPVLLFWKRRKMARAAVGAVFAVAAILCWIFFDITSTDGSQLPLMAMTLLPATAAGATVLAVEYYRHRPGYHRHNSRRRSHSRRRRRRSRRDKPSTPAPPHSSELQS